jgi:hypothetical protein
MVTNFRYNAMTVTTLMVMVALVIAEYSQDTNAQVARQHHLIPVTIILQIR